MATESKQLPPGDAREDRQPILEDNTDHSAHPYDTGTKLGLALLSGTGLLVAILALAFGVVLGEEADPNAIGLFFAAGLIVFAAAGIAWFALVRPDLNFDDIDIPKEDDHGHAHDEHHDSGATVAAEHVDEPGEVNVVESAPPEKDA